MKKYYLFLLVFLFFNQFSYCQHKEAIDTGSVKEGDVDLALIYFPVINKNIFGLNFNIVGFPNKFWGTGLSLNISTRNLDTSYQRNIKKPSVTYGEVGWINEFRPINTHRLSVAVSLVNGLSFAALEDRSIRVGKGYKDVVDNYYYLFEPGIDFAFKISKTVAIIIKDEYRFIVGYSHFAKNSDFSSNIFSLGIRVYAGTNH
ncbi:MAG TPA: hypothetical protein VMU83_20225 [Hanamia sp.]|nr:hypothetical protein [Hanamia sp.]